MSSLKQKNELLVEMAAIVIPVAEDDPLGEISSSMYRLIRSTLRKNIMRVQAIIILNRVEKSSDSALEIVRNTIEDVISVSYILSDPNPEELASTFFEYRHVQSKQDLDHYSGIKDYIGEDLEKDRSKINAAYKKSISANPVFMDKEGNVRHAWTKDGVEGMIKKLIKRKLYTKEQARNMMRAYQLGSRKVHFNPHDILNYYDQSSWDKGSEQALEVSIKTTAASLMSLIVRYYDTLNHFDKTIDGSKIIRDLYKIHDEIYAEENS